MSEVHELPDWDFDYDLPNERIAQYPLSERSASKLLYYRKGDISHHIFKELPDLLPSNTLLIVNQSSVIPARWTFDRPGRKTVEVLLLRPHSPYKDPVLSLSGGSGQVWSAMVGNRRGWKAHEVLTKNIGEAEVQVSWFDREENLVQIQWGDSELPFSSIVEKVGQVPLPPYLNREPVATDYERYQTVYSAKSGSVAAPTAGLHFDLEVLERLEKNGHKVAHLCLHVGAGTFLPVKQQNMLEHPMHSELFEIQRTLLSTIINHDGPIIAVGTTTLRALESMRYLCFGDQLLNRVSQFPNCIAIGQNRKSVCGRLHATMRSMQLESILADTSLMIYPGYETLFCDGIITNFHQPKSTLVMLISALIGENWRKVYRSALENDYRFLSYGDSSLLLWG